MTSKKISPEEVKRIAHLARLEISPQDELTLADQLSKTASYIEILSEIDTTNVAPTFQTHGQKNITRDDLVGESLTQEEALSQATDTYNGYFKTQATINKK